MSDSIATKYSVWDKLFELIFPCDEELSDAEIDAELHRRGIDMKPAYRRLHKMVEMQKAQSRLAAAKSIRATLAERVRDVVAPKGEDLRAGVRNLIGRAVHGKEQSAYFHKLEGATSEEDLQSLLDDLEKLAAIREVQNDPQGR